MANKDNPRRGARFETLVQRFFARRGLRLGLNYRVNVGMARERRPRTFDLGSARPPILVECKGHTWTAGGNAPSGKFAAWTEAMLYFAAAPHRYRRILAVLRAVRGRESLAEHYVKRFGHLVPRGVEIWEVAPSGRSRRRLYSR
jgi:hypothetical protein